MQYTVLYQYKEHWKKKKKNNTAAGEKRSCYIAKPKNRLQNEMIKLYIIKILYS